MFSLFGKRKKKQPARKDPATKKEAAMKILKRLKSKYNTDEQRIDFLQQEIKEVKKLLLKEKRKKKPDKRMLKRHFQSWKLKEKQMDTHLSYLTSTQKQIDSIETQVTASDTVELMKQSAQYIKANQPNVEEVEEVTADLTEQMDDLNEVNELIAEHGDTGLDEEEMMGELDELTESEDEVEDVELPEPTLTTGERQADLPVVPTSELPSVAQPQADKRAPSRIAVPVGVGGGTTKDTSNVDDEAELAAWFE